MTRASASQSRPRPGSPLAHASHAGPLPVNLAGIDETLAWARAGRHPAVEAECLWHHHLSLLHRHAA